jgi:hypothetical protein
MYHYKAHPQQVNPLSRSSEGCGRRETRTCLCEKVVTSANPYYNSTAEVDGIISSDGSGSAGGRMAVEEKDGKKVEWISEMESLFKDVETLFDIISGDTRSNDKRPQRRASVTQITAEAMAKGPRLRRSLFQHVHLLREYSVNTTR